MQTLAALVAVVMAVLWIVWVLAATLALIEPTNPERWLSLGFVTIVTAPVVFGGFRLLDRTHHT